MKESINVKRQKLTSSGQPWSCQPLYCKCHTVLTFLLGPESHNKSRRGRGRWERTRTVCQLQRCCCIRAWLWAEPERQQICEKFEKETNTRYNFMQKILEWWETSMMLNELDEKPFSDCELSQLQWRAVVLGPIRYWCGRLDQTDVKLTVSKTLEFTPLEVW